MPKEEFRHGPLGVYEFDHDDEIEIQIEDTMYDCSVYLTRPRVIQLRDWLARQIKRSREPKDAQG